jgi:hypothetical protein
MIKHIIGLLVLGLLTWWLVVHAASVGHFFLSVADVVARVTSVVDDLKRL